jgi:asparagine synthetase B (glutamine-hydrolysing)
MCGILGIASLKPVHPVRIARAVDILRPLGPDDEGFMVWERGSEKPSLFQVSGQ